MSGPRHEVLAVAELLDYGGQLAIDAHAQGDSVDLVGLVLTAATRLREVAPLIPEDDQ